MFGQISKQLKNIERKGDHFAEVTQFNFRELRKETHEGFARLDGRIDKLTIHVDGFAHRQQGLETEFAAFRLQHGRLEERVDRLESQS